MPEKNLAKSLLLDELQNNSSITKLAVIRLQLQQAREEERFHSIANARVMLDVRQEGDPGIRPSRYGFFAYW